MKADAKLDRLDQHWRTLKKNKSNPDHLNHAFLYDAPKSKATGRPHYHKPVMKVVGVSLGLVKSQDKPNGDEQVFLHFDKTKLKLGLNVTNSKTMARLTGQESPNGWVGTTIQLYVDPDAKYPKNETGPAIRISPRLPKAGQETTPLPDVPAEDLERLENEQAEKLGREPGEEG